MLPPSCGPNSVILYKITQLPVPDRFGEQEWYICLTPFSQATHAYMPLYKWCVRRT